MKINKSEYLVAYKVMQEIMDSVKPSYKNAAATIMNEISRRVVEAELEENTTTTIISD